MRVSSKQLAEYEKRKFKVLYKRWCFRTSRKLKNIHITEESTAKFFMFLSGHSSDPEFDKKIKKWLTVIGTIAVLIYLLFMKGKAQ